MREDGLSSGSYCKVGKNRRNLWLKVHLHNIIFLLVWPQNPFRLLLNHLKCFILVSDWPRNSTCCKLYIFSVYIQILCIPSIHLISFCVFSVYIQFHSAHFTNMHSKNLFKDKTSFCICGKSAQIHSSFSQHTFNFFLCFLSIRTEPFSILFGQCTQINSIIGKNNFPHSL